MSFDDFEAPENRDAAEDFLRTIYGPVYGRREGWAPDFPTGRPHIQRVPLKWRLAALVKRAHAKFVTSIITAVALTTAIRHALPSFFRPRSS